jgi:hypothetical protein
VLRLALAVSSPDFSTILESVEFPLLGRAFWVRSEGSASIESSQGF